MVCIWLVYLVVTRVWWFWHCSVGKTGGAVVDANIGKVIERPDR